MVTYVSTDGAFGGPIAVAVGQARELARRGHRVDLLAGWDGDAKLDIAGVTVRLFPARQLFPGGFSGLVSPRLLQYMLRNSNRYDVVHVHLARDLITLPVANLVIRRDQTLIAQTHGMVMPDRRLKTRVFDGLAMRSTLVKAKAVLALTEQEKIGLASISAHESKVYSITNGVEILSTPDRPAVAPRQVVFLARLHPRKRVMAFAEAAHRLIMSGVQATFHVVGPDEGDLANLLDFIAAKGLLESLLYEGAIPSGEAGNRLSRASVYVLPSFGEIVPMTALEAMAVGTPVVITHDCGLAPELEARDAAVVTDGTPDQLASAIAAILDDRAFSDTLTANANLALSEVYSIGAVVDALEKIY